MQEKLLPHPAAFGGEPASGRHGDFHPVDLPDADDPDPHPFFHPIPVTDGFDHLDKLGVTDRHGDFDTDPYVVAFAHRRPHEHLHSDFVGYIHNHAFGYCVADPLLYGDGFDDSVTDTVDDEIFDAYPIADSVYDVVFDGVPHGKSVGDHHLFGFPNPFTH